MLFYTKKKENKMSKKKWQTPKLVILSRLSPQEFVLAGCKQQQSQTNRDPGSQVQMCGSPADPSKPKINCAACQNRGQS